MENPELAALFRLFESLPQQGPGSDACTLEALARLPALPERPRVVDMGCGAGRQTLALAAALHCPILAIDVHQPFLDRLRAEAGRRGLAELIETRCADMADPGLPAGSVDLLWSEGAVYNLGFARGLALWRPLMAPGGLLAATECSWLADDRPPEAAAFWARDYPAMAGIAANRAAAEAAGYTVLDTFSLPPSAWWEGFYTPLARRIAELRPTADAAMRAVLAANEAEIDLYRRHSAAYGYVFYLMQSL
ncbi:MAG: class I SAM-dependent methyltransferase [Rhodospirillales bacterium]|nr:class I SAM-dependent methyltransferase [Rhodospirillales bacterium]